MTDSNHSEPHELLLSLIELCQREGLNEGDIALVKSAMQRISEPEEMDSLLARGFECTPFLEAAAGLVASAFGSWPNSTLARLAETLLFQGLDPSAAIITDELHQRAPQQSYAIRLWALSAGSPEATMRRFASALETAEDPATVIADARDFARRNVDGDLMTIIDTAVAGTDTTAGG